MSAKLSFFAELGRRNVLRAGALYAAGAWLLVQVVTQVLPLFDVPSWSLRWVVIACAIGFPFWLAFAWFFEITPSGLKRESQIAPSDSIAHSTGRKLDFWIIGIMAVAIVLLVTNQFVLRRDVTSTADTVDAKALAAALARIPQKSVAVLPFENLSDDKNNEYFVAGVQDLILTKLADIGSLKVISRTSTMQYGSRPGDLKTIGAQLGVATILEGSVQKANNRVLVNVQLIDTRTDRHIWAQSYTRTLDNVFGVEGEVAEKVAAALKAKLSSAESARLATDMSANPAANNLFLSAEYQAKHGQVNHDTASWKAAIPLYRQAIEQAPNFALAYARLSYTESQLAWFGGGGMDVPKLVVDARSDAEQAIKLAPNLSAAHLALGYSNYYGRGDYADALKAFTTALALRPNDADALAAQGYVQRRQGRFDTAIASLQQAFALDPRNSLLAYNLGVTAMSVNLYSDAERWLRRAQALDPHNRNARQYVSTVILLAHGDVPRALAVVDGADPVLKIWRMNLLTYQRKYGEALALLDSVPDTSDNFGPGIGGGPKALAQAELYRLTGDTAQARLLYAQALPKIQAQLTQQRDINQAFVWQNLAVAELGIGRIAQGLDAIAKAKALIARSRDNVYGPILVEFNAALYAEARRPDLAVPLLAKALTTPGIGSDYSPVMLWLDPAWDPIRHDLRFQALLGKYANDKPDDKFIVPVKSAATVAAASSASAAMP